MSAESRRTSFFQLSDDQPLIAGPFIERIEVPIFQRDYAQGRHGEKVEQIRADFLDVLVGALGDDGSPVGLDFVYGGVDDGTLRPLDGQQRLTTLFLLHWYVASRSGHLAEAHGWKRFSYATRQSARMFCEALVTVPLPDRETPPSKWIEDQPWYLFLWRHDPTIQSMLVMLDAIDERFDNVDVDLAWARLTDAEDPAIWFLLLPLDGLGSADRAMKPEDLYIKMNSRGKPLSEFENFKAHFEKTIESSPRAAEFALKVDTTWSDLLWHLRGDDGLIDDRFLRYLEFVTEICEWRDGGAGVAGRRLGPRTRAVFGNGNPQHAEHLEFLFNALDTWVERSGSEAGTPIAWTFRNLFSTGDDPGDGSRVRLFFRTDSGPADPLDLFEACCHQYGVTSGKTRLFSLGQTLVLYAVVLHLIEGTVDFPGRVRMLRNLVEASPDSLRPGNMPKLLEDVHHVIRHGVIGDVATFNQAQVDDEQRKAAFLQEHPDLLPVVMRLEDHEFLRGSLGAFEYDAACFEHRAAAFHAVMSQPDLWPQVTRALLAVGEYQRQRANSRPFLFGTDSNKHRNAWRELLTGATRQRLQPTREVLAAFLDAVASATGPMSDTLSAIASDYLARCEDAEQFDWRYYMVKYPDMQANGSSTYFAEITEGAEQPMMGYSLCMLRAGVSTLNSNYRDPYLLTIARQLEDSGVVEDKWFSGYETHPRRLPLTRSGTSLRCVPTGFELSSPPMDAYAGAFAAACSGLGVGEDDLVVVPQVEIDGRQVDTVDRIQLGAGIVRRLMAAGL